MGERLLICNEVATNIVNGVRRASGPVFHYKGKELRSMNNSSWQKAKKRHQIDITIHGLRHTFAHRLRAAQVDSETRADLLGHRHQSMTAHYSMGDVIRLFESACKASNPTKTQPLVTLSRVI